MKIARSAALGLSALLVALPCQGGKTNILPGLTYYDGKEKLEGRLVFLASAEALPRTNGLKPCFLYELDLPLKKLHQVARAPTSGYFDGFIVSADGKVCAATFPEQSQVAGSLRRNRPHWVWMYREAPPMSQTLSLDYAPLGRAAVGYHLFFQLAGRILDCDLEGGTGRFLELPGVSKWERQAYDLHAQQGKTNEFCFQYHHGGARTVEGKDYDFGTYVYELQTGQYRSMSRPEPSPTEGFRACDGSLVSLAGIDDPFQGHELMRYAAPGDQHQSGKDGTGKSATLLKRFKSSPSNDIKSIRMSPCRRYVLIREEKQVNLRAPGGYDTLRTYHVVNVLTGHAWVLLKDDVERKTGDFMSDVHWVPGRRDSP